MAVASRRPAFLVMHGSFNPVHRQHLEMMVSARRALEAAGFDVQQGILGITPLRRLLRKGAEPVTDAHRLAALQLACDATCEVVGPPGWLMPEGRGVKCGSGSQFVKMLLAELTARAPGAVLFKLVGADTAVRYPGELSAPTVVVCRQGSTADVHRIIQERGLVSRRDLFLTDELPGEECSSTKLREALTRQDVAAIRAMCFDVVADYLLANREDLYARDAGAGAATGEASVHHHTHMSKQNHKGANAHGRGGTGEGRWGYAGKGVGKGTGKVTSVRGELSNPYPEEQRSESASKSGREGLAVAVGANRVEGAVVASSEEPKRGQRWKKVLTSTDRVVDST